MSERNTTMQINRILSRLYLYWDQTVISMSEKLDVLCLPWFKEVSVTILIVNFTHGWGWDIHLVSWISTLRYFTWCLWLKQQLCQVLYFSYVFQHLQFLKLQETKVIQFLHGLSNKDWFYFSYWMCRSTDPKQSCPSTEQTALYILFGLMTLWLVW